MSTRDEYIAKMRKKLEEWSSEISKLEAKAATIEAHLQEEHNEQINFLKKMRDEATVKLTNLKTSSDSAWEDLKSGVDLAWESMSIALKSAADRYN